MYMFAQIPERSMHYLRWVLTIAWLILIFSEQQNCNTLDIDDSFI